MITLGKLPISEQYQVVEGLTSIECQSKGPLRLDLQNMNDDEELRKAQKAKTKIILLLGRKKSDICANDFCSDALDRKFLELIAHEKSAVAERLKSAYVQMVKNNGLGVVDVLGHALSAEEISAYFDLIHGCRPDGWICSEDFAILVESKIGINPHSPNQVYRHLTDKMGFRLAEKKVGKGAACTDYKIVSVTWQQVFDIFHRFSVNHPVAMDFIKYFKEYLIMCGEVLDLSFISKGKEGYNQEIMKNQFPLFLNRLDDKVAVQWPALKRCRRHLDGVWDYYGLPLNGSEVPRQDPHYSIFFNSVQSGISLTTKNPAQMRKLLGNEAMQEFLESYLQNDDPVVKKRLRLSLTTFRLLDHRPGQIRGDKQTTFNFSLLLSEIAAKKSDLSELLVVMGKLVSLTKQLDITLEVLYPGTKVSELRDANRMVLNDAPLLVDLFAGFMKDTRHLFEIIRR